MINIIYEGKKDSAPKDVFGPLMEQICQEDPQVVYLDADLMACIGTDGWAKKHPRAFNCGIAEGNMASVAAGLAAMGFKPYIHSFGPFASRRCYDQIFISAAYAKNAVTVVGSDPGVTATNNGGTHMPFEDVALYSAIPGSTIIDVSDCVMLKDVLPKLKEMPGVKYLRVPRKISYSFFAPGSSFEIGKAVEMAHGTDAVIFAAGGVMLNEAMKAEQQLRQQGVSVSVVNIFTIKPLDEEAVLRYVREAGCAVVAENHNVKGGLCSAVSELLAQNHPVPLEFVAVNDSFGEVGPVDYLQQRFGLTAEQIVAKTRLAISRK